MLIYKITNIINNKVYVGQTIRTLRERKWQHLNAVRAGHKNHLYNAMRKYGVENFEFSVIRYVKDVAELNRLERYYIKKYDSVKTGYNMVDGGRNNIMFVPEVKKRHANKMRSKEVRDKISNSMREYRKQNPFTLEHRRKLSKKAFGNHNFGNSDTRSIACKCVLEDGTIHEFHSYRDAWRWWSCVDNPFISNAECVYQRAIKQSIDCGYYTYGRNDNRKQYYFPKWFRKEVVLNETVC